MCLYKFRLSTRSRVNSTDTQTPYVEHATDTWELSYSLREVDGASAFRQEHIKAELKQYVARMKKKSPLAEGYKRLIKGHFVQGAEDDKGTKEKRRRKGRRKEEKKRKSMGEMIIVMGM